MDNRRVVITGLGAVTSVGVGAHAFGDALKAGKSGIRPLQASNVLGFPAKLGSEVHGFEPGPWVRRLHPDSLGRCSHFAIAAARQALEDSGIDLEALSTKGCGVSVGTTDGESQAIDHCVEHLVNKGVEGLDPMMVMKTPADRLSASVASEFRLKGETITVSTACAAGNYAIGNALDLIKSGETDFALGGGAESIARKVFAGFSRLGAIAPDKCRPFDLNRQGMIPGEGAGMLFLETLESAKKRGARIYAELLGYGLSCDAKHATAPDKDSIVRCMKRAHAHAGIRSDQVDYISAHGTGTKVNDKTEAASIMEVFDKKPPMSSIKSMIGHTMGAASALGAVACVLAIKDGFMPPTINFETPDPECPIDCVPNEARRAKVRIAQNNGYGFGGNNAVIILAAYEG